MSAIRLPLLCAFAGGCLSNVLLFALWRASDSAGTSPLTQRHRSHAPVELVSPSHTAANVQEPAQPAPANAADLQQQDPARPLQSADSAGAAPAGSAVSDVLGALEAAYRAANAASVPAASAPAPGAPERAGTAVASRTAPAADAPAADASAANASAANASAANAPAANAPAQSVAEVAPVRPAVTAGAVEARPVQAQLPAPVAVASQDTAPPAVAAAGAPFPAEIHYGDVNQNTYITNIRQGDVYQVQLQQLAILQYMQLLGASSGAAAPARRVGVAPRQRTPFPSGITNPDNPWGFQFAPPNLVR